MVVVTVAGSRVERDVDRPSVVQERLEAFAGEVLAGAMNRPVQVRNGGLYLRGLIEDGARKSLERLVLRLGADADYQSMQQFLADSPWDPARVVQAVAERVAPVIGVEAWVLDDTGFPKDGKDSPGVKRQYTGTLGKIANCQIGVSVHAVGKTGTVPLGWALYLPEGWCEDAQRRRKAKIPDEVVFKTKVELAGDLVERASGWAVPRAPVLGDHDYGRRGKLRARLDRAGCEYVLAVGPEPLVFEHGTTFERKTKRGGVRKRPRPDRKPEPLGELIARLGQGLAQTVSFRDGPDGRAGQLQLHPHARARRACAWRAAAPTPQPPIKPRRRAAPTRGMADRRMAPRRGETDRLLALKPPRRHHTRAARQARPAALEDRTRLQATQRRARPGPLRRPLLAGLVSPHRSGHRRPWLPHARASQPFSPAAGLTLAKAVLLLQPLFKCWTGRCQTCRRRINIDRLTLTLDRHDE